ncbi:MAG: HAD family phosphatase [Acidobacteriota bacterium]
MTRETRFDVLLFDLGGVLINFSGFDELARLLPGAPDRSEIRHRWIHCEPVQLFERGDITPETFALRLVEEFKLGLSPEDFIREFVSWARGPYPGALSILRRLRAGLRVACLSNSNELHTPLHRASIQPHIDTYYFSDEIGMVKPDHEIFDYVIRDLATPPRRIAFFDDTPVNVEAAREAGLNAFLVDGVEELEIQLQRLGLIDH